MGRVGTVPPSFLLGRDVPWDALVPSHLSFLLGRDVPWDALVPCNPSVLLGRDVPWDALVPSHPSFYWVGTSHGTRWYRPTIVFIG